MISSDVRNNSAWNQRAFVLQHKLAADSIELLPAADQQQQLEQRQEQQLPPQMQQEHAQPQPDHQMQASTPLQALVTRELEYVSSKVWACGVPSMPQSFVT
jgi:hypothetical protein